MGIGQEIEYLALVYIYGMKKETFEDAPSVPRIAVIYNIIILFQRQCMHNKIYFLKITRDEPVSL